MSEVPNVRRRTRAPRPSTRYDSTHWKTGSLASHETTGSAASIRRRRQLREDLESSRRNEQLIAAQLEAHRKSDAIRRALRDEENLADNDDALSARSHPSSTASFPAWMEQHPLEYQAIPDSTPFAVPAVAEEALQNSGTTPTTTMHVSADLPRSPVPASARDQPGAENETGPVPPKEIAPAPGAVLESTTMERPPQLTVANMQVSQPTHAPTSHLLDLTIDQPATQHSTQNSSSALPPPPPLLSSTGPTNTLLHHSGRVSPTLSSISSQSSLGVPSLAQTAHHITRTHAPPPPAWPAPALLPVVDIPPPPPPMHHHSVTFGQPTTARHMHPPMEQHGPSSERERSLLAEVNRLHAQLHRQTRHSQLPPSSAPAADRSIQHLADTIATAIQRTAPAASQPATPGTQLDKFIARQPTERSLPSFNGAPDEWPVFFNLYKSTTEACGFTAAENLGRLQRCLKGKARDLVHSLLSLPTNVPTIIRTLEMRYGRPDIIIRSLIGKVQALPPVDDSNLIDFAVAVQNLVTTIQAVDAPGHLYNPQLRADLVTRLPSSLRLQWGEKVAQIGPNRVTLADLSTWLSAKADAMSYVANDSMASSDRDPPKTAFRPPTGEALLTAPPPPRARGLSQPRSTTTSTKNCTYCGRPHWSDECRTCASLADRRKRLQTLGKMHRLS